MRLTPPLVRPAPLQICVRWLYLAQRPSINVKGAIIRSILEVYKIKWGVFQNAKPSRDDDVKLRLQTSSKQEIAKPENGRGIG